MASKLNTMQPRTLEPPAKDKTTDIKQLKITSKRFITRCKDVPCKSGTFSSSAVARIPRAKHRAQNKSTVNKEGQATQPEHFRAASLPSLPNSSVTAHIYTSTKQDVRSVF